MSFRNLIQEERNQIIILNGQDTGHMSRNTVRLWIKRNEEEGILQDRPRAPRPCLIGHDNLLRMVDTYQQQNALTPTRMFAEEHGVSLRTVHRALHRAGLHHRKPAKTGAYCAHSLPESRAPQIYFCSRQFSNPSSTHCTELDRR